jgi:hypothetical protein
MEHHPGFRLAKLRLCIWMFPVLCWDFVLFTDSWRKQPEPVFVNDQCLFDVPSGRKLYHVYLLMYLFILSSFIIPYSSWDGANNRSLSTRADNMLSFMFCFYEKQISSSLGSSLVCSCVPDQLKNNTPFHFFWVHQQRAYWQPPGSSSVCGFTQTSCGLNSVSIERWGLDPAKNYRVLLFLHNPSTSTKNFLFLFWVAYPFLSTISVVSWSRKIAESVT